MPTFPALTAIDASLKVPSGGIEVIASDRTDVVVTVAPSNPKREQDVRAATETTVEFDGHRLTVVAPKPRVAIFGPSESIEVTVELPTGSRLTADAGVGPVRATGTLGATKIKASFGQVALEDTGDLEVRASHGTVSAGNIAGSLRVNADHGNIRVGSVAGAVDLKSSHGSMVVGDTRGDVEAKLSYGDLEIGSTQGSVLAKTAYGSLEVREVRGGTLELETGFGSITVGVLAGVPAWLDVSTKNGHVRNELDATGAPASTDGSVSIRARSTFGDIRVHRAK